MSSDSAGSSGGGSQDEAALDDTVLLAASPALRGSADPSDALQQAALKAEVHARMFGTPAAAVTVGRYAILKVLGEGGMGTVYAAFDEQLDRRVALKLLKGADSPDARGRMLREAQALAKLSHPNVVPVFEVGEHEGRLFVAMEYVRGVTLRRWRDDRERGWREVVEKYVQAGRGLAAAHAAGLVHRDFKPHNAVVGDEGRVRVLDFGLAARRGSFDPTDEQSLHAPSGKPGALDSPLTETGAVMGTPAYMAPEQFMGGEVDPRSDQFSFCVALWEALYGTRPFSGDSASEILMRIAQGRVVEPRTTGVPARLRPVLERGLKPRAAERWSDMTSLLAELEQWEHRARRRRRIGGVLIAGAAIAGVYGWRQVQRAQQVAACDEAGAAIDAVWNDDARARVRDGLLATGVSYAAVTAEKVMPWLDEWAEAWRGHTTLACMNARVHRTWTTDVLDRATWCLESNRGDLASLVDALAQADATLVGRATTAAVQLPGSASCVEGVDKLQPPPEPGAREAIAEVRAELRRAYALRMSGRFAEGLEVASAARVRAETQGWPPVMAATALVEGDLLAALARPAEGERVLVGAYLGAAAAGDWQSAAAAAIQLVHTVGAAQARHAEGRLWASHAEIAIGQASDPAGLMDAQRVVNLASVLSSAGEFAEARASNERALEIQERVYGYDHPGLAYVLGALAQNHLSLGDLADALALGRRALEIQQEALGADHPSVGFAMRTLADIHVSAGEFEDGRAMLECADAVFERGQGPASAERADVLSRLAQLHLSLGNLELARSVGERAVALAEQFQGHDYTLIGALNALADACRPTDAAKASALFERALSIAETTLGKDNFTTAGIRYNLAMVRLAMGDARRARALAEQALPIIEKAVGPDHAHTAAVLAQIANADFATGDFASARGFYERAIAAFEKALGPDHPRLADPLMRLGVVHTITGDLEQARTLLERAASLQERGFGAESGDLASMLAGLADLSLTSGDVARARARSERAIAITKKVFGPEHPAVAGSLLCRTQVASGELAEARTQCERAVAILEKAGLEGHGTASLSEALVDLADVHAAADEPTQARALYVRALELSERELGPDHPSGARPLVGLASLATTRPVDALPLAERAIAVTERSGISGELLAARRLLLARALWDAPRGRGRDRPRAVQLAEQAQDAATTTATSAAARAWLSAHEAQR